jgi:hypothetical protein
VKNGDISNELPKRYLIATDIFLEVNITVKKIAKIFPVPKVDKKFRRDILSFLYLFTTKAGVTLEVVSFDLSDDELSKVMDTLDNMGTNPFRYFSSYESVNHLVSELPYRPEVLGVVDVDSRLLRYGHWGKDFKGL